MSDIKWWGYMHVNGTVHIKRYFDDADIREASESPFVERLIGPVPGDRDYAAKVITLALERGRKHDVKQR